MLGATVQNLFSRWNWCPRVVHRCAIHLLSKRYRSSFFGNGCKSDGTWSLELTISLSAIKNARRFTYSSFTSPCRAF